jgi:hypothetical protein
VISRKDLEGSGHDIIFKYYPNICLRGLKKTTKTSDRIAGLWADT